jgi:CBS domain-containing protein
MSSQKYSITPDKTIKECMDMMNDTGSRYLPVFENNLLIGIVSVGDVANSLIEKEA